MKIQTQIQNGIAILQLQGEFTVESLKSFEEAVSNALASGIEGLVLDMSRVILLDSASLEQLIELNDRCRQQSRQMKLAGLDETCQKILEITRLLPQMDTYAELTEAVRSFV
jgi:anti-anti-sigma factor